MLDYMQIKCFEVLNIFILKVQILINNLFLQIPLNFNYHKHQSVFLNKHQ